MKSYKSQKIGLITSPIGDASRAPVSNLVNILLTISRNIYFITGNAGCDLFEDNEKIRTYGFQYKLGSNVLTKIIRYTYLQFRISYKFIELAKNADTWIFFMGSNTLILPIITAKFMRKIVILSLSGSFSRTLKFANNYLYIPVVILERINYTLASKIIVYSSNLIKEYRLEKYKNKISIAYEHFLDFEKFKIETNFDDRANLIGYIGRLSGEKGVMNFVRSIQLITKKKCLEFMIVGDGQLKSEIEKTIDVNKLNDIVELAGWIPHDKLSKYLNNLKLIILPSYTEGLPNVMLEAMACGTPILAIPVGTIPDVIKDGETGFLMENNSPEYIAKNVIRALEHPDLEGVVLRAQALAESEFTFERAIERWRKVLEEVDDDGR